MEDTSIDVTHRVDVVDTPGGSLASPLAPGTGRQHRRKDIPLPRPPLHQQVVADLVALVAVGLALASTEPTFALVAVPIAIIMLRFADLYRPATAPQALDQLGGITQAAGLTCLVAAALSGVGAVPALAYASAMIAAVFTARGVLYRIALETARTSPRNALIVGTGADGQAFAERLLTHAEFGLRPTGFIDDDPDPIDPYLPLETVGAVDDLPALISAGAVDRLIIDAGSVTESHLLSVLDWASRDAVEVTVLPVLAQHLSTAITVEGLAGTTALTYRPSRHRGVTWTIKRTLDLVGAVIGIVVTLPISIVTAIAIKLDSPGPVIFRQQRVGQHGELFTMWKFRSMVNDAEHGVIDLRDANEAHGPYFKVDRDPRITKVGRWIRRFSIDEIPQFVNVLRNEMSLVGPRPALEREVAQYPEWFRRRMLVPPGVTGMWQVSGRFLLPFGESTRLDVFYVDHWSLGLDLKILAKTLPVVLSGRGAR